MHESSKKAEMVALLGVLSSFAEWEVENAPLLTSPSGRHLYYSIAKRAILNAEVPMVKDVVNAKHITDRSLRSHLSALVNDEYLYFDKTGGDARVKKLIPSTRFHEFMNAHLKQFSSNLNNYFMVVQMSESRSSILDNQVFDNPYRRLKFELQHPLG
jgi:hypothetical protein